MKKWLVGGLISAGVFVLGSAWSLISIILATSEGSFIFIGWAVFIAFLIAFMVGAILGWIIGLLVEKFSLRRWIVVSVIIILIGLEILLTRFLFPNI